MSQACRIGLFTERIHFLTEIIKLARPSTCQFCFHEIGSGDQ